MNFPIKIGEQTLMDNCEESGMVKLDDISELHIS